MSIRPPVPTIMAPPALHVSSVGVSKNDLAQHLRSLWQRVALVNGNGHVLARLAFVL
jgi:hypothetical protein